MILNLVVAMIGLLALVGTLMLSINRVHDVVFGRQWHLVERGDTAIQQGTKLTCRDVTQGTH